MRAFGAALFATACLAEQTFDTDLIKPYANVRAAWPVSPTTPLTFDQIDTLNNFTIMTDGQTKGNPDPPELGKTDVFTVAGLASHPITIDKLEFICYLFGAKVYDEKYAPTGGSGTTQAMPGTVWTGDVSFDVPSVAPSTQYDI